MRIAIVGGKGQLGLECCRQLGDRAFPLDLPEFDMTDRAAVLSTLGGEQQPSAIVNCAAYTLADKAESEPALCHKVNAEAVGHLVEAARRADCPFVQISTDYVFGGDRVRHTPYLETDPPDPLSVYGKSKLGGERVAAEWPKHFVVRSNALFGLSPRNNNFVEAILRLARERGSLRVVDDQTCSPTYVGDLARALLFLLTTEAYGIYHIVGGGNTTWYGFAAEILRQTRIEVPLERITTEQFNAAAQRPIYSVMNTAKYHTLGGPRMRPWQQGLSDYLSDRIRAGLA
jgi:dTDP-4-dehydrorhamnose reductase